MIQHGIHFSVRVSFHCNFEEHSGCLLKQSNDGDLAWDLIPAQVDSSRSSYDHTTLSGKNIGLLSIGNRNQLHMFLYTLKTSLPSIHFHRVLDFDWWVLSLCRVGSCDVSWIWWTIFMGPCSPHHRLSIHGWLLPGTLSLDPRVRSAASQIQGWRLCGTNT